MIQHTLSNGLRLVAEYSRNPVSYIGFAVNAGSRDDPADSHGLAHFLEHTIFKGTTHRNAWHISDRMDSIGGDLNAYTSHELTMVHTMAPSGYTRRTVELLADMVKNSIFPEPDIMRERNIIIEEINMYRDAASDAVFDDFDRKIFAGSDMGHDILGTVESVNTLDGRKARAFLDRYYVPSNMVVYVYDDNPDKAVELIERNFGDMDHPHPEHRRQTPQILAPFDEISERGNSQANTVMGCRIPDRESPLYYPMLLFSNYLGGPAMTSILNQQVREKRGLAYAIDSNVMMKSDFGTFTVYFGCDPSHVKRCRRIVCEQIARLADKAPGPRTFKRLVDQYCGMVAVSYGNRNTCAMNAARSLMFYNQVRDVDYEMEHLRAVTPDQFRQAAETVASQTLSCFTIL